MKLSNIVDNKAIRCILAFIASVLIILASVYPIAQLLKNKRDNQQSIPIAHTLPEVFFDTATGEHWKIVRTNNTLRLELYYPDIKDMQVEAQDFRKYR